MGVAGGAHVAEIARAVQVFGDRHLDGGQVCIGLSGGADSLALTAGAVAAGLSVTAVVVDHRIQDGSDDVARTAAARAEDLGAEAMVVGVDVGSDGGPEAAARDARYAAFDAVRADRPVLLAHTLDDQAETVLLGLARGSGPRSIAGMVGWSPPWGRPLLDIRRAATVAACGELGLIPYIDPHNSDPRFTRSRLREEVLPLLDDVLRGGVAPALARTAAQLRADLDTLDALAADAAGRAVLGNRLDGTVALAFPPAIRRRVLRTWILDCGATEPTARLIEAVDGLLTAPDGRTRVAIGGDGQSRLTVACEGEHLVIGRTPR